MITAGAIASLLLPVAGVAIADQQDFRSAAPTLTSIPGPTTTWTTTDPSTTWTTPTTTDPTSTDPTTTWTTPTTTGPTTTWTIPTTTTEPPPPTCADPGPEEFSEAPGDTPAEPPTGGSSANDHLIDVGGRILDLVDAAGHQGFAGVVADPHTATLWLYWLAGEPLPPDIEQVVIDPGAPVDVERLDATYTRSHLDSVGASLLDNASLSDQICGFLHTIKVLEEGSGLKAGVEPYDGSFNIASAQALLSSVAGVPVTIEVGPQPFQTGRVDDRSPWHSGGRVTAPGRGQCSTAFGIVNAGTRVREYMLTADHCFRPGDWVENGNRTRTVGDVSHTRPQHDSQAIRIDTRVASAGDRTFFGGTDGRGAAEYDAQVNQTARNVRGTAMCTSGASTGENCNLEVVATRVSYVIRWWEVDPWGRWIMRGLRVWGMVDATSTRPGGRVTRAVGSGDSGGPVVTDSSRDRRALGTMSAGLDRPIDCGPFRERDKLCFHTVRYADITVLLDSYVAELR